VERTLWIAWFLIVLALAGTALSVQDAEHEAKAKVAAMAVLICDG
jgi:hypothetical protein